MTPHVLIDAVGRLCGEFLCPDTTGVILPTGCSLAVGSGQPDTHYVNTASGTLYEKSAFSYPVSKTQIIADNVDTTVITGLPANTLVTWPDGQIDEVNDGEVEFGTDLIGTHTLIIDAVPYLKQEIQIEAIATT